MAIFTTKITLYTCKGVGMSWINDLDALASAGVIDFDAPAYIMGTRPRYYGNPALETIPDTLPQMNNQPKTDEFKKKKTKTGNPAWKKWLFGLMATAGIIFGASKLKFVKNLAGKITWANIKALPQIAWDGIKAGWKSLTGLFKKTTP